MKLKPSLLTLLLLLTCFTLVAASPNTETPQRRRATVSLVVKDSVATTPMEAATVTLTKKGDAIPIKYGVTNAEGKVSLADIPQGTYKLSVIMMGYLAHDRTLVIEEGKTAVDAGTALLREDVTALDGVTVSAIGNPIIAKKDTLEYTASSFHTTENAVLEDLLKKLPGVEVDADGSITVNGEDISKVMIDGKEFFANDPQMATKNLPANIVDKVRVVNRKSDQTRFTGIDDGTEETVLDLKIKDGMFGGMFGNASAGYGTNDRAQGGAMVSKFTEDLQLTAIGNVNNTNSRNFGDLMGGGGGGGFGMGGRWGRSSGETVSYMGALNGTKTFKNKSELNVDYRYTGSDNKSEQRSSRENLLPTRNFTYDQHQKSTNENDGHSVGMNLELNPSEKSRINFRPRVNINRNSFEQLSEYASHYPARQDSINKGESISKGQRDELSVGGSFNYSQRIGEKAGHTITLRGEGNYQDNNTHDAYNISNTTLFGAAADGTDSLYSIRQRYSQTSENLNLSGTLTYTLPIMEKRYVEASASFTYNDRNSVKIAHNYNPATDAYDIEDTEYSNTIENLFTRQRYSVNYRSNQEKYQFSLGFDLQPSQTHSVQTYGGQRREYDNNVTNYSPSAQFEYIFTDSKNLRVNYYGSTEQPSINQLQRAPDNSNPLYVSYGNPELLPAFRHQLRFHYSDTDRETFRTFFARLESSYRTNVIINKTWYDEEGVRYSQPVNEGHSYDVTGAVTYNTPINRSNFYINNDLMLRHSNSNSYSDGMLNNTKSIAMYETLRFTYRGEKLNAGISGRFGMNRSWYTLESSEDRTTWNNNIRADIDWSLPFWDLSIRSDFSFNYFIGYSASYNQNAQVWNATIQKLFLKKKATLALQGFDMLNQTLTIRRTVNDNYIEDYENLNVLRRYFMLTFTYRFGNFSGNRGGRGPGMGRGMGGPMMMRGGFR